MRQAYVSNSGRPISHGRRWTQVILPGFDGDKVMPLILSSMAVLPVDSSYPALVVRRSETADDVAAAFLSGYEASTRRAYETDLREWFQFCATHRLEPLEARRAHVDLFATKTA